MSLLLDALRSTESSAPAEANEEAIDGREALKILTATMPPNPTLTLETSPPSVSVMDIPAAPDTAAVPSEAVAAARSPPIGHTATAGAARLGVPPLSRAAPLTATPARRLATMFAFAIAVVTVVMLGKSLLYKNSNQINYPEVAENPPAAVSIAPHADPNAVQVPSRPASQFSGVGGAPEIDLHQDLRPATTRTQQRFTARTIRAEKPVVDLGPAAAEAPIARGSLSVTASTAPASIDAHIESGYRALASGDLATAQREYRAALELDSNNVDALLGAASVAARAGDSTRAAAAYRKVLKLEPGNKDATAALTLLSRDPTATEENESRLKVMIAGDQERRPALHAALAGVYAADRRWADAAQEYFIALSMDPGDPEAAFNLAASLDQNHNYAAALTYYAQALALAKQRAAQIDVHAVEARISQLQARAEVQPATARATP